MGTKYTTQGITGYNADPPPDDGTTGDDNKVTWDKHLTKLTDPIIDQVSAIDTKIVNMVDIETVSKSANYTTVEDDNGRVIECTASPDITLGLAATMGSGYRVTVKTVSGTTTVSVGGADEIDGSASDRTLIAGGISTYTVNDAADGYLITGGTVTGTIATGSHSFGAILSSEFSSTWEWAHGLGTDDVDWGFSVTASVWQKSFQIDSIDPNGYLIYMIGSGATDFTSADNQLSASTSGTIAFRAYNDFGATSTIQIKVWARTR